MRSVKRRACYRYGRVGNQAVVNDLKQEFVGNVFPAFAWGDVHCA